MAAARPPELARASSVGSDGDEFARDLDAPAEDAPRGASAAGVDDEERPRAVPGRADEGDRAAVHGDVAALLAFGTVVALTFGVGIGGWYLRGLEHERMMAEMLATGAY